MEEKDMKVDLEVIVPDNETEDGKDYILEVDGLKQYFPVKKDFIGRPTAYLRAVDGVSFKLERGKTLGVVGESGCGKTTLGRTILRLYDVSEGSADIRQRRAARPLTLQSSATEVSETFVPSSSSYSRTPIPHCPPE